MKSGISSFGLAAALLSTSVFAACQNTARGVEQDTERNTAGVKQEAREANAEVRQEAREANAEMKQEGREANAELRQETREAGNAAERTADRAGDATARAGERVADGTRDATRSVGSTLDAAAQTMQIKTALIDADNLDANNINVDTDGTAKTVTLKGYVSTASQKAAAERIAKEKAPGYRVINSLTIR